MTNLFKAFIAGMSFFIPTISFAVCAGASNTGIETSILFVNGIMNNSGDTQKSAKAILDTIKNNGFDTQKVNVNCFYNGTEGAYDDIIELRVQAAISSKAKSNDLTNTRDGYYARLGAAYKGLADKRTTCDNFLQYSDSFLSSATQAGTRSYEEKFGGNACTRVISVTKSLANSLKKYTASGRVIAVAHSQGNFYLEAAYSLLMNENYQYLDRIQGVGIAAISQHPVSNRYITLSQDNALYFLQNINASFIANLNYAPAKSNSIGCAKSLECLPDVGKGQNPRLLATLTGSAQIPSDIASKIEQYGFSIPEDKRALIHEIGEVYLNEKVLDTESGKSIPKIITELVSDAYDKLNQTQPPIITSPLYDRYTGATGEACYSRQIGTQKSAGVYTLSNSQYCRSGGQWVNVTGADNERYLDTQGNLYPFSSIEIKDTGNNTYTAGYGGSTIWNISYTQKSAGTYSQTVRAVSDYYSVDFDPNSYIYNNVEEFAILLYRYNTSSTNTGYLTSGGTVGFLFEGPSTTSGSVKYFSISDPNRSAINTGAWTRKAMGANTEIIELDEKSTLLNSYPDPSLRKIYYRGSSAGVREGNKTLAGRVDSGDLLDRNTINAIFAREGLPATPN